MRIQRSSITCHETNGVYLYPTSHSSPGKAYTYDGEIKVHCFPSTKNKGGCKTLIKYGLGAVHSGVWYETVLSSSSPVLVCSITVLAGGGNHTIAAVGWSEIDHTLKWYAYSVFFAEVEGDSPPRAASNAIKMFIADPIASARSSPPPPPKSRWQWNEPPFHRCRRRPPLDLRLWT